ncbi:unnamed protein product [Ambrosiozyma monospora]|uniref:Unnamed protein product n=1 Tax=Ambrosiozyma monospora TaxID=43982 RepID=A0ACB5TAC9_AMBMO|nr:unnamed protein product [Ambrosiozyma monospora]
MESLVSSPPSRMSSRASSRAATPLNNSGLMNHSTSGLFSNSENRSTSSLVRPHIPVFSPNWEEGYYRLVHFDQGIFYENSIMKVVYRLKRDKSTVHLQLTYSNKSPSTISGFTCTLTSNCKSVTDPGYTISTIKNPDTMVYAGERTTQMVDVVAKSIYTNSEVPLLTMNYICGGVTSTLKLKMPTVLLKTLVPGAALSKDMFFTRWNQIGTNLGSAGEGQKIFKANRKQTPAGLKRVLELAGFNNLLDLDPNPDNLVCAGILHTTSANSACLLRLELNPTDLVMIRLTVRCTLVGLSDVIVDTLSDLLANEL